MSFLGTLSTHCITCRTADISGRMSISIVSKTGSCALCCHFGWRSLRSYWLFLLNLVNFFCIVKFWKFYLFYLLINDFRSTSNVLNVTKTQLISFSNNFLLSAGEWHVSIIWSLTHSFVLWKSHPSACRWSRIVNWSVVSSTPCRSYRNKNGS